jgi:hypothetical protein
MLDKLKSKLFGGNDKMSEQEGTEEQEESQPKMDIHTFMEKNNLTEVDAVKYLDQIMEEKEKIEEASEESQTESKPKPNSQEKPPEESISDNAFKEWLEKTIQKEVRRAVKVKRGENPKPSEKIKGEEIDKLEPPTESKNMYEVDV